MLSNWKVLAFEYKRNQLLCSPKGVETLQEKETKSEVKDEQGCDLIRSCPVNIWCVLKWGIRTAILVGIMIYQWIHGHPFSDKLIYRYDTCSWTSISHVSRTIHIQVLMVESGRVAQLPMLKFCRDFVAGEEKQKGQKREAFSRQLFQSSLCAFSWLRKTVMFLYIFDFEEHKSQPMSTHQWPFFMFFFLIIPWFSGEKFFAGRTGFLLCGAGDLGAGHPCGLRMAWEWLENGMVNDYHPVYGDMYN